MKKTLLSLTIVLVLIAALALPLYAADEINHKIDQAATALDKNGNEYVRFLITFDREKNGIPYKLTVPVMAFGEHVNQAKTLNAGDTLHCVASKSYYQGRESWTIRGFAKPQ